MEAVVSILNRRRSGSVTRRDHEVSCEALRFGRSAESDVRLGDPRIATNQATLFERDGGYFFESFGATQVSIDGTTTKSGTVKVGSEIRLGPYEVKLVEAGDGVDVAVTVELVDPLGEALDQLKSVSRTSLAETQARRRTWAWGLSLIVLGVFLAWPLVAFFGEREVGAVPESPLAAATEPVRVWPLAADLAWDTGKMSGPHKFLADNCTTCHQKAFVKVGDAVCSACHAEIRHHVNPATHDYPNLTKDLCQSCHKEHQGEAPIVLKDQDFCADCHRNLSTEEPDAKLFDVRDFGRDHPEFRPTVMVDATQGKSQRLKLDPAAWPVEQSNLRFSHKAHLKAGGIQNPELAKREILNCASCHTAAGRGARFVPVQMEENCSRCHRLQFDPSRPARVVPHGNAPLVLESVTDFYRGFALEGGHLSVPQQQNTRRRPGGAELTPAERQQALQWANTKTDEAADYLFGKSVCGTCHVIAPTATGKTGRSVAPVKVTARWMPKGLFDHTAHLNTSCHACHETDNSDTASDVLLPPVATCQTCHGGEVSGDRVPSTCVMCHEFHQPHLGIMRPEFAKAGMSDKK